MHLAVKVTNPVVESVKKNWFFDKKIPRSVTLSSITIIQLYLSLSWFRNAKSP